MEAHYTCRKTHLLDAGQVAPEMFAPVVPRLYTFMEPFVKLFPGQATLVRKVPEMQTGYARRRTGGRHKRS